MKIKRDTPIFYVLSGLSIAILVIFVVIFIDRSKGQGQYIDAVEHTYKVLSAINFCEKELLEAETAQRGYLLTADNSYNGLFESTLPLIDSSLKLIGKLTAESPGQQVYFAQLSKFVGARVAILKENLKIKEREWLYYENLRKGTFVMDNCRIYMTKMRVTEETRLQARLNEKNKYQRISLFFFKVTLLTASLICVIALLTFLRELGIRITTQEKLKAKIDELSSNKQELEEITFAASHDLQEPMRKVRILSSLITKRLSDKIPTEDLEVVQRINNITEKMHNLLNDLVLYTNLLDPKEKYGDINLGEVVKEASDKVFARDQVNIQVQSELPVIHGSHRQLENMLVHLLDNSLKFKDPGRDLIITVNYEVKLGKDGGYFWQRFRSMRYHQITITDNGIGFEKQYNDKIFGLFQRLHTQEAYPGKGLGLSVARRVMSNHKGQISSFGHNKEGASFILYFPFNNK